MKLALQRGKVVLCWALAAGAPMATIRVAAGQDSPAATALSARPPRGSAPSVPNLARLSPRLVPGVGQLQRAYSPCLTADLKTIVFANWMHRQTEYDLYIATRKAVDEPFGPAERIEACVTPWTDANPALSVDGLELVFVSSDDANPATPPKLLRSRCPKRGAPFGGPEEVKIPGVESSRSRFSNPQFIDARRLKFCLIESDALRTVRLAERADDRSPFKTLARLPMANHWPLWWISADGLRAYASVEAGIVLSVRQSAEAPFGPLETVIPASVIGKIDGPIWLAPQEDVIFYCAPGDEGRPDAGRHLMMIAF